MKDKCDAARIYARMGRELAALSGLIADISTDPEYQAVMTKALLGKLLRARDLVDRVRSDAECRMFRLIPVKELDTSVFYPCDRADIYAAVAEFRAMMEEG